MSAAVEAAAVAERPVAVSRRRPENQALNVLRAVAALLVVFEHVRGDLLIPFDRTGRDPVNAVLYPATQVGYGAVLVFFVLSGYFVGGSVVAATVRGRFDWRAYVSARLTRLWIVLVPALLLTLAVDEFGRRALSGSGRFKPGSESARNNSLTDFLGNLGFVQGHVVPMFGSNGALWSLAFEATYYLAFPLVVAGGLLGGPVLRRLLLPAMGVLVLFWVDGHIVELLAVWLLGAAVAWQADRLHALVSRIRPAVLAVLRVAAVLLVAATLQLCAQQGATRAHTVPASYLTGVATALLIVAFLTDVRARSRAGRACLRFFSVLAGFSFSLYATHLPLVTLLGVLLHPRGPTAVWYPGVGGWLLVLAVSAVCVAAAWVFARGTEYRTAAVRARLFGH